MSLTIMKIAEAQTFRTRIFGIEDGLSGQYTTGIWSDSLGFLWVGTPSGIARFNGKRFTNYCQPDGIPGYQMDAFMIDSNHKIWVGCRGGIAYTTNYVNFKHIKTSDGNEPSYVFKLFEYKKDVFAVTQQGIMQYAGGKMCPYKFKFQNLDSTFVRNIIVLNDEEGLLIQTLQNTYECRNGIATPIKLNYKSPLSIQIHIDKDGCKINDGKTIMAYPSMKKIYQVPDTLKNISFFHLDSKNRLWVIHDYHELIVKYPDGRYLNINKDTNLKLPLSHYIKEDFQNNIWISGLSGLVQIKENMIYDLLQNHDSIKHLGAIRNVKYRAKNVYARTSAAVFLANPDGMKPIGLKANDLKDDYVLDFEVDSEGNVYSLTAKQFLYVHDSKNNLVAKKILSGAFKKLYYNKNSNQIVLVGPSISTIDSKREIKELTSHWCEKYARTVFATYDKEIILASPCGVYVIRNDEFVKADMKDQSRHFVNIATFNNQLWFSTNYDGIYRYQYTGINKYTFHDVLKLSDNTEMVMVNTLQVIDKERFVIGNTYGLTICHLNLHGLTNLTKLSLKDGLNRPIYNYDYIEKMNPAFCMLVMKMVYKKSILNILKTRNPN
ncbi:MAG: hypothetical protein IPO92_19290 [Saprospiraceae bacterium]|nr:hypothetical protein [Saprospiraceae bacterium]